MRRELNEACTDVLAGGVIGVVLVGMLVILAVVIAA